MNPLSTGYYLLTGKLKAELPVKKAAETARRMASEGIVLLKNDGTLPMKACKAALFGAGAEYTTVCGTGSGYAFSPYRVTVREGLENAGFEICSEAWLREFRDACVNAEKSGEKLSLLDKRFSGITKCAEDIPVTDLHISMASAADTAVYVIRRNTGENFDRKAVKGDYYLSENEEANIRKIAASFKRTVVVLNTCVIDASVLESIEGVSAIILLGQAGMEAGNALADIITGKITPSGKLTDTWALSYDDYPASATFSANDGQTLQEDYSEDIFVGYRHFDKKGLDVVYPFGYGLSYTGFSLSNADIHADSKKVSVSVSVKNTGDFSGKEVVQVYASAPAGKLIKPVKELKAYKKTKLLAPGVSERVSIDFNTAALSSYDSDQSAYVMEKGLYTIWVGTDSRSLIPAGIISLDEAVIISRHTDILKPDREIEYYEYPDTAADVPDVKKICLKAADFSTCDCVSTIKRKVSTYIPEGKNSVEYPPKRVYAFDVPVEEEIRKVKYYPTASLIDVKNGKVSMEEFVASLDTEVLLRIVTGDSNETKYPTAGRLPAGTVKSKFQVASSGKTTNQYADTLGIPAMSLSDGPAGLHLMGSASSAYPVGMVCAQSWNPELIAEVGDLYGTEMEHYNVAVCLGPGMNIHRDPLCGRNFEYYSEDPVVTGLCAAAFTNGLQLNHPGYGVAVKHFAVNNQEIDRTTMNATVSQRALREIYLKGFEICVKEAQPLTLMSSYNCLNGPHTSSNYELLTDLLRGEWGFEGFVMTDWDSQSDKTFDLHAGNDIIMGGYPTDIIAAAVYGRAPEFEKDGGIKTLSIDAYGGFFKKTIKSWNSFSPSKDGKDRISVKVPAGTPLSQSVSEAVREGYAVFDVNPDGSRTVTYSGTDMGAYLTLGEIQRNAMRILKHLMNKAPMELAIKK